MTHVTISTLSTRTDNAKHMMIPDRFNFAGCKRSFLSFSCRQDTMCQRRHGTLWALAVGCRTLWCVDFHDVAVMSRPSILRAPHAIQKQRTFCREMDMFENVVCANIICHVVMINLLDFWGVFHFLAIPCHTHCVVTLLQPLTSLTSASHLLRKAP